MSVRRIFVRSAGPHAKKGKPDRRYQTLDRAFDEAIVIYNSPESKKVSSCNWQFADEAIEARFRMSARTFFADCKFAVQAERGCMTVTHYRRSSRLPASPLRISRPCKV